MIETPKRLARAVILAGSLASSHCFSFETQTHALMSAQAVAQSRLGVYPSTSPTFASLGLLDYDEAYGKRYLDLGGNGSSFLLTARVPGVPEQRQLRELQDTVGGTQLVPELFTFTGWLVRGAIREDDNSQETPACGDPANMRPCSDEPGGVFSRPLSHFFDPYNDRPLRVQVSSQYEYNANANAMTWAIDPATNLADASTASIRSNSFNVAKAREAMWRALTLKAKKFAASSSDIRPPGWEGVPDDQLRSAYWATTFRALGDVLHLLQDMAQPQHTRNEPHNGGLCVAGTAFCALGHASFFEFYMLARTLERRTFTLKEGFTSVTPADYSIKAPPLNFNNGLEAAYPIPMFNSYSEYFSSGTGSGSLTGKGLANYSNRGFYSAGTNAGSGPGAALPSPPPNGAGLLNVQANYVENMVRREIPGATLTFKVGAVPDYVGPTAPAVKLATRGLWDQFLEMKGADPKYTLNYYNYDDQANLLIPRAVAYSAGLLNYFFRGKLEIGLPAQGVYAAIDHTIDPQSNTLAWPDFKTLRVKVRNRTPDIGTWRQDMTGDLVAVVKFRRNTCFLPDLSGEWGAPEMVAQKGPAVFEPPAAEGVSGCRSAVEEIVVSAPQTNKTLFNDAPDGSPYNFDFTDHPIPIQATDISLQIVFRGSLGSEADAVVVETRDMGEPAFTTYLNSTNYMVCHNGQLKRRDQLLPADNNSYPNLTLTNFSVSYGTQPLVSINSAEPEPSTLAPGTYVKFATLGDLNHDWTHAYSIGGSPSTVNHNIHPSDPRREGNQVYFTYDGETGQISRTNRAREVNRIPFGYTPFGRTYFVGNSNCDGQPTPDDLGTVPTALAVTIAQPF